MPYTISKRCPSYISLVMNILVIIRPLKDILVVKDMIFRSQCFHKSGLGLRTNMKRYSSYRSSATRFLISKCLIQYLLIRKRVAVPPTIGNLYGSCKNYDSYGGPVNELLALEGFFKCLQFTEDL